MVDQVNIDTLSQTPGGNIIAGGDVASVLLANGMNVNALRTLDTLRKDEWVAMDNALIEVARKRLILVNTLREYGLTYELPNGLGTTQLEWEDVDDMSPANVSMSGVTEGETDTLDFSLTDMPLPIIHKDFTINIRKLLASRTRGEALDTTQLRVASTLVMETIESMIILGHATRVGSSRIYGLTTHPDRNTGSITASWDLAATSGASKLTDIQAAIALMQTDHMYGPFGIFVSQTAYRHLNQDYSTQYQGTQKRRLEELDDVAFIRPSTDVPAGAFIMVQLDQQTIDEVIGLQPTVVQWDTNGGMVKNFKVMAIMIPRIRSTYTGQSGVVHLS